MILSIKYLLLNTNDKISNYRESAVSRGIGYEKICTKLLLPSPIKNLRTMKTSCLFLSFPINYIQHKDRLCNNKLGFFFTADDIVMHGCFIYESC